MRWDRKMAMAEANPMKSNMPAAASKKRFMGKSEETPQLAVGWKGERGFGGRQSP
jgi:hypothetical protein